MSRGEDLTLTDIVYLELTPLMNSNVDKNIIVNTAMELSSDITDPVKKEQCLTALVGLALKSNIEMNEDLRRRISMSKIGQEIYNEGIEKGIEKGTKNTKLDIAKSLLDILDDKTISEKVKLPIDIIHNLRIGKISNHN